MGRAVAAPLARLDRRPWRKRAPDAVRQARVEDGQGQTEPAADGGRHRGAQLRLESVGNAIDQAEATIDLLLTTQAEIGAAGGANPERYEAVATGKALREFQDDATRIAEGPILNEDGESIEGQSTVEGSLIFEPATGYGQEYEGIANGLVIVPGCLDGSQRKITTADGKPAMQNPNPRNEVEFHVIYNAETKTWLVNDRISLGTTC